jgi:hypothetical protein
VTPDERARFDELVYRFNELSHALADVADTAGRALQSALYNGGRGGFGGGGFPISPAVTDAGGISDFSGSTPGSGTVILQELSGGVLVAGASVTCLNNFPTTIAAGLAVMVGQDFQGNYWVLSQEC